MKTRAAELEQKRIDYVIEYFEKGCLCVLTGMLPKATTHDQKGIDYYWTHCSCTRHPESSSRDCWDVNLSIDEKLKLIAKDKNHEVKK